MPTPPRTSLPEIVAAGRAILEAEGLDGLRCSASPRRSGFGRRRSTSGSVAGATSSASSPSPWSTPAATMGAAVGDRDPAQDLRAIAHAFRAFALAHPNAYALLFARLPDDARIDPERNARAAETLLRTTGRLAGSDDALEAARTVTAWAHGFLMMELGGAFRLGGDVDRAFDYGIDHLTGALRS